MSPIGRPPDDASQARWDLFRERLGGAGYAVTEVTDGVCHLLASHGEPEAIRLRYFLLDPMLVDLGVEETNNEHVSCALFGLDPPLRFGVHVGADTLACFLDATLRCSESLARGELEAFAELLKAGGLTYFMEP